MTEQMFTEEQKELLRKEMPEEWGDIYIHWCENHARPIINKWLRSKGYILIDAAPRDELFEVVAEAFVKWLEED